MKTLSVGNNLMYMVDKNLKGGVYYKTLITFCMQGNKTEKNH